ncbi:MAG: DUF4760 domain-containing protein [Dehalococcoidia bacterium]
MDNTTILAVTMWATTVQTFFISVGVIVAIVGLIIARKQVINLANQLHLNEKAHTASILFELDKRYEDIYDGRKMCHNVEIRVDPNCGQERKMAQLASILSDIKANKPDDYFCIRKVFDFCETAGFLMEHQYISETDVCDMWGPSISSWGKMFKYHIMARQTEEGGTLYEYFLLAAERCDKLLNEKK